MKKTNKILAIDIGNTTISYGLFHDARLIKHHYVDSDNMSALIKSLTKCKVNSQWSVVMSSVVPNKTSVLKKALQHSFKGIKIWSIGENMQLPLKMKYQRKNLGADRLVNLYGAIQKYKAPLLVIDCGTAITFDYVSRKRIFLGGLIVPGLETSWKALQEKATLLPKHLKLELISGVAARLAPTNTKSAMYSGLLNGFGALIDGLIGRFKKKYGRQLTVLATGGASQLISKYSRRIDVVDPLHTLRSLDLIYRKLIQSRMSS